jgi:hypothetical protein
MTDPTSPATATTPPPPPSAPTAPVSPPTALTAPPGTALEIAQMLKASTIDAGQAGKLSRAAKVSMADVAAALHTLHAADEPRDLRSPEEKQFDNAFPAAKPEEFLIRAGDFGPEPTTTAERAQFDANARTARTWLSGAGFPRETGNSLVSAIAKVSQQTQHMTADQLETYGYGEFEKLQKVHGPALDEKLQAVDRMVQVIEAKQPGLVRLLKSKGIMDNAMVANLLIAHAQIYHARRGR